MSFMRDLLILIRSFSVVCIIFLPHIPLACCQTACHREKYHNENDRQLHLRLFNCRSQLWANLFISLSGIDYVRLVVIELALREEWHSFNPDKCMCAAILPVAIHDKWQVSYRVHKTNMRCDSFIIQALAATEVAVNCKCHAEGKWNELIKFEKVDVFIFLIAHANMHKFNGCIRVRRCIVSHSFQAGQSQINLILSARHTLLL